MIIAELEVYHSRPIAPTRRVALGMRNLPVEPAPGPGGVLLAGIMATAAPLVEAELREDLVRLLDDLEQGRRVPQPRVRHRFQTDRVGLLRSTHRLIAVGDRLEFEFDDHLGIPVQQALGALYAAGSLPADTREPVFDALRLALVWGRDVDAQFISAVMGGRTPSLVDLRSWNDPVAWALELLELEDGANKRVVQKRFRVLLREAHPDHGGRSDSAAKRISELTEARDILLAVR